MTDNRLNEIRKLINKQNEKLIQIILAFEVALDKEFLENEKSIIHTNLLMINERIEEALYISEKAVKEIDSL